MKTARKTIPLAVLDPQTGGRKLLTKRSALVAAALFFALFARADVVVSLGSGISTPGGSFTIPVTLTYSAGGTATNLQWTFTVPPNISFSAIAPARPGQPVTCDASLKCALASPNPIPAGAIAFATFNVSGSYTAAIASIAITGPSALDSSGSAIPTSSSPGGAWISGPTAPLSRNPCANIAGNGLTSNTYVVLVAPIVVSGVKVPAEICGQLAPSFTVDTSTIPITLVPPSGGTTTASNCAGHQPLTGAIDGTNLVFQLPFAPTPPDSLDLYRNGLLQDPALDFALNGATVTFMAPAAPQIGDTMSARLCK